MTKVTITYELLDRKNACECELNLFKKTFPKGISVTSEEDLVTIAKKFGKKFYIHWASEKLLTKSYQDKYLEVQQPAYDKYLEVQQPAWDKYLEVRQQAYDKYLEVEQQAYDKYLEVEQQACDKYLEVRAIVFAQLYYQQETNPQT